jgi:hypothetical protein
LLDEFMPVYDVAERHHVHVAAPAGVTFAAARDQDLMAMPIVEAIFRARQILLGGELDETTRPRGLVALTKSLGWGVLAEIPDRELVMGAVTQPWLPNVRFRSLPPGEFVTFNEPDFVKIVWTLRADAAGADSSIFRTETRAVATNASARAKFRRYWSFLSPGIILIRWASLNPLKKAAERRAISSAGTSARTCAT